MVRKTETRDRLIRTAAALFSSQGYGQTGVSQIMEQAHATSGSFYHFFPAKEDLLLAVVDHVGEILEAEIFAQADEATDDPLGKILAVVRLYRRRFVEGGSVPGSPLGDLAAELSQSHPRVRTRIARLFEASADRIGGFLRMAGDGFAADVDRSALAWHVVATLEGAVLLARAHQSVGPFDAATAELEGHLRRLSRGEAAIAVDDDEPNAVGPRDGEATGWRAW